MGRQQRHWLKFDFGWYAVEDRLSGELVGWCGLNVLEETDETEIKYLLKKSHWWRGLATEAASRCIKDGFRTLEIEEIIGLVHPENIASRRVLEKLGMQYTESVHYWGLDLDRYSLRKETIK